MNESIFAVLRSLTERSDACWERAREIGPRFGQTSVGSQDFDYVLEASALDAVLSGVRRGLGLEQVEAEALEKTREVVAKWNNSGFRGRAAASSAGEYKRWDGAGEHFVRGACTLLREAMEGNQ